MPFEHVNGTMPARGFDWGTVKYPARAVREFAQLRYGKALREPDRLPGSVRVFGTNGPCGWHDAPLVQGPGVVLGRKGQGHLGVKWVTDPFWVIDTAYYADVDVKEADLRWFYYITKYVGLDHLKGGEKPGLNRDVFGRQLFPFPRLPEQRAIAGILGALDDKIELNRQLSATLEGLARALFESWFVDFDPVVAKAAGQSPAHMSSAVATLFPGSFVESELGLIPEGWRVASVPDILEVNPPRRLAAGQLAPYLDMQNMPTRGASPDQWIGRKCGSGMRFTNGDTLVARITPCLENGKTAFVNFLESDEVGWGSTEYIVLRSKPPLPLEFSYFLARNDDFRAFCVANMTGSSGRQRVPSSCLREFQLAVPDDAVAAAFGKVAAPILEQVRQRASESHDLALLRDSLNPKLLSGEVRLRQAKSLLEADA